MGMLAQLYAGAQELTAVPLDPAHWDIRAREVTPEQYKGVQCLKVIDGAAYLKDQFESGIVEFDMCFDKDRCFPGLVFRQTDDRNFDFLYFRPHQSGNPDAIQYCPIYNGDDTWQLFTGTGYTAQVDYTSGEWMHVKVIISGSRAALYLNHQDSPTLYIYDLQRPAAPGVLALDNHSPVTVRFANFSYEKTASAPIVNAREPVLPLPDGMVKDWELSRTFPESSLQDRLYLDDSAIARSGWEPAETGTLGFVNILQYRTKTKDSNTVLAAFTVQSGRRQSKRMSIGFSDRCKVYLNNRLLYAGSNTFKSRDYRFYGTIGLWDDVYLDLKKGINRVVIAVAENFGGWGVEARFSDRRGITFPQP